MPDGTGLSSRTSDIVGRTEIRYRDFDTHTFAKTLPTPTCVDADIHEALAELLPKARERRARVRLIGVALSSLSCNQHQMHLFGRENAEKWERALEKVDTVREKMGFDAVRFAKGLGTKRMGRHGTSENWE